MAELSPSDLSAAVRARFGDDDEVAQLAIDTALVAARRYCGWHVSPQITETLELDGPGGQVLSLPSLQLVSVVSVTEHGDAVDVTKLDKSRRKGTLTKPYGRWSCRDGAIIATVTHGYTEAEALDWRAAVVALVDTRSQVSTRDGDDMKRKKIGEVEYEWFETAISVDDELSAKFAPFRILPSP